MGFIIPLIGTLLYFSANNKTDGRKKMFLWTIFVSTFITVNNVAFKFGINCTYNFVCEIIFIIVSLGKNRYISKKTCKYILLLLLSIFIGFVLLIIGFDNKPVVPWSVSIDSVYYGNNSMIQPFFSSANISAFINLIIFIVFLLFSQDLFSTPEDIKDISNKIIIIFRIMFVLAIIEFIINNFIDSQMIRKTVVNLFGVPSRGHVSNESRLGLYTTMLLFGEPSYFSVLIVYFLLMAPRDKNNNDYCWNILGMIVLIISGSSTGIFLLPVALFSTIYSADTFGHKKSNKRIIAWGSILLLGGVIMLFGDDIIDNIFDNSSKKLLAYLGLYAGTDFGSGTIRNFGNGIMYGLFSANPLFGYGLGTSRGYGILPGMLGTIGLLGTYYYVKMMSCWLSIKYDLFSIIMLVVFIVYSTTILSVWYMYESMITIVFIALKTVSVFCDKKKELV